jgi:kynurenine 3-monooxygenase
MEEVLKLDNIENIWNTPEVENKIGCCKTNN